MSDWFRSSERKHSKILGVTIAFDNLMKPMPLHRRGARFSHKHCFSHFVGSPGSLRAPVAQGRARPGESQVQ